MSDEKLQALCEEFDCPPGMNRFDFLREYVTDLRQQKTPATRSLLNLTKAALDSAEAENARLRAALEEIVKWGGAVGETARKALANEQKP